MAIVTNFEYTRAELLGATRRGNRRLFVGSIIWALLVTIAALAIPGIPMVVRVVYVGLGWTTPALAEMRVRALTTRTQRLTRGGCTVTFTDDALQMDDARGSRSLLWAGMHSVVRSDHGWDFTLAAKNPPMTLPARVLTAEQEVAVRALLHERGLLRASA